MLEGRTCAVMLPPVALLVMQFAYCPSSRALILMVISFKKGGRFPMLVAWMHPLSSSETLNQHENSHTKMLFASKNGSAVLHFDLKSNLTAPRTQSAQVH
jgi:hypothetical protein